MIQTLMDLIDRDIDDTMRQLNELQKERRELAGEREYWRGHLTSAQAAGLEGPIDIAMRLRYGERADRELKMLVEKDFLVETRITECRNVLLQLTQRKDALREVLVRRERDRQQIAQRRQERDRTQRGIARRVAKEAERELWD